MWLVAGRGQGPPTAVAQLGGATYHLHQAGDGQWALGVAAAPRLMKPQVLSTALAGEHLTDVAASVGLDFRQGSFRYGMLERGAGDDGRRGLLARLQRRRLAGPVRRQLVLERRHRPLGGERRAAADGALRERPRHASGTSAAPRTPTCPCRATAASPPTSTATAAPTSSSPPRRGSTCSGTPATARFTEGARAAGMNASGWYTGVTVADVNGDGRPDLFVAGYAEPNRARAELARRLPDEPRRRPRPPLPERGQRREGPRPLPRGRRPGRARGGGATARARRPVRRRQRRRPSRPLRRRRRGSEPALRQRAVAGRRAGRSRPGSASASRSARAPAGVADPYAGMGIASRPGANGSVDLFVTNSRGERSAAFQRLRALGIHVRERPLRLRPGARHRLRRLGSDLGRPRQLRHARSRARRGRDPGDESRRRRRAGARARAGRHAQHRVRVRGRELRPRRQPEAERARRRGRGRRERRAHERRDQHDRRQARAPRARQARAGTGSTCSCPGSPRARSSPSRSPTAGA